MLQIQSAVRALVISVFKEGNLTNRITLAQRNNDSQCLQPRGVRLGYMGHLTYISDEVVKLGEKCGDLDGDLQGEFRIYF